MKFRNNLIVKEPVFRSDLPLCFAHWLLGSAGGGWRCASGGRGEGGSSGCASGDGDGGDWAAVAAATR